MQCDRENFFWSFWATFWPFTPIKTKKNQNFEKYHFTQCTKNHDHMLYCSWDMGHDGCNYFSFWAIFCPFTPITARKIKIYKMKKQFLEISPFYTSAQKAMIICYNVPEIWCVMDVTATFHFGLFLPFYPSPRNSQKNYNLTKTKKTPGDIIILHICSKNYDQLIYSSWDMVHNKWTDRQMDGWKKWALEEDAPPKNDQPWKNKTGTVPA